MALSAEIQHGVARIYGIPLLGGAGFADQPAWTIATIALPAGSGLNPSSIGWTDSFKVDEIPSADGSVMESLIASQRRRELAVELIPSSTSSAPSVDQAREFAKHIITNMKPYSVFVLSGFHGDLTWINSTDANTGSWNYMGGGEIMLRRDTYCIVNVRLAQFVTRADGAIFAALPIAG